jgi:hypothetical protein
MPEQELREWYTEQNATRRNYQPERPLIFKDERDGRVYVAGIDSVSRRFVVEHLDWADLAPLIAASSAAAVSDEGSRASEERHNKLATALASRSPACALLWDNGRGWLLSFFRLEKSVESARTLADYRRSAGEQRLALEVARTAPADSVVLSTGGLNHGPILADLFRGRFESRRSDYRAWLAVEQYIVQFSALCRSSLPADAVEITQLWTRDHLTILGGVVTSRSRVSEQTIRTGVFATPTMARAYGAVGPEAIVSVFTLAAGGLAQWPARLVATTQSLRQDMGTLLQRHGCDSPAMTRLANNLLRFVEGRPGEGGADEARLLTTAAPVSGAPAGLVPTTSDALWRLDFGVVPEDFVPRLPADRPRRSEVAMTKSTAGALVGASLDDFNWLLRDQPDARRGYLQLREAATQGWRPGVQHPALDALADPGVRAAVEDMAATVGDTDYDGVTGPDGFRHYVLQCQYRGGNIRPLEPDYRNGGYAPQPPAVRPASFAFWYKKKPTLAEPGRLKQRSLSHPLLSLGAPRDSCPAALADAEAAFLASTSIYYSGDHTPLVDIPPVRTPPPRSPR